MKAWPRGPGWERGVILALITITAVQHALWVRASTAIETWDDDAGLYHLATCIEDGLNGLATACFAGAPYPPLVPSIAGLHFWLTSDRTLEMALHSLWVWPVLLCVCLYVGGGRDRDRRGGYFVNGGGRTNLSGLRVTHLLVVVIFNSY